MSAAVPVALDDVRFRYGGGGMEMAFDATVEAGSLTAVMGASGSGKSTLFSLIAGFERPDAGRILIGDIDVTEKPPADRPVSMVFQENNLFAHLDVETNVGLGIAPRRSLPEADRARVAEALGRVGLAGKQRRKPAALSGGERQRVALARTLVRRRPVLMLDEPFAALGPRLREEMLELVRRLHDEARLTTLMITHQPADARAICDRILFLDAGTIAAHERAEALFARTDLPAWRNYLGNP